MTTLVFVICILIVAIGIHGILSPKRFVDVVRRFNDQNGLYIAEIFRILFGVSLIYVAPTSYWPIIINILGAFYLVAGLSFPFVGLTRFHNIVEWWCNQSPFNIRLWAVYAVMIGVFVGYAVSAYLWIPQVRSVYG